ncbi:hypothetical protein SAY87_004058 [Trapa incisa]|uniref:Uncharacterized protein n=1 Tax=Trapa incisa TaxID=236973 RepID=A0AAN7JN60_9MYRT|nr:hypothetical protein SAY87_004058 [Trapa incisa]
MGIHWRHDMLFHMPPEVQECVHKSNMERTGLDCQDQEGYSDVAVKHHFSKKNLKLLSHRAGTAMLSELNLKFNK